jgi:hypothetical protein
MAEMALLTGLFTGLAAVALSGAVVYYLFTCWG